MVEKMLGTSTDTDNKTEYALTCNVIRGFCEDAIKTGRLPEDYEIQALVGAYAIDRKRDDSAPLMLKPTEAAKLAHVSQRTIVRMCDEGQLVAVKLRGSWRINRAEFMKAMRGGN